MSRQSSLTSLQFSCTDTNVSMNDNGTGPGTSGSNNGSDNTIVTEENLLEQIDEIINEI